MECNECGHEFEEQALARHMRKHKMLYQEYVLKWKYGGIAPKCKCNCNQETSWNVALKDYAGFVVGHHAWGRKKTDEEKKKIGEKNSVNVKKYWKANPELAKQRNKLMRLSHTEESEKRRKQTLRNTYANMSDEQLQRFSEHTHELWNNGVLREAHVKASETFKKRSIAGEYDFTERNKNLSKSITQKYLDGGFKWARGHYTSSKTGATIYYRSDWERQYAMILDNDPAVTYWEYEFTSIPYVFEGIERNYIPDFHVIIDQKDMLIEVKPISLQNVAKNIQKRLAAEEFCKLRGWVYQEWSPEILNKDL